MGNKFIKNWWEFLDYCKPFLSVNKFNLDSFIEESKTLSVIEVSDLHATLDEYSVMQTWK